MLEVGERYEKVNIYNNNNMYFYIDVCNFTFFEQ